MKTTFRSVSRKKQGEKADSLLAGACLICSLSVAAQETASKPADDKKPAGEQTAAKAEESTPEYNNWITLGFGSTFIDGDKAQFMQRRQTRKGPFGGIRSEEHTSELQSQSNLVCRLLLEKKKK